MILSSVLVEARLMVGAEFRSEDNEVVGNVFDARSQVKYATEPRDAHVAGSVRATVSRLLRSLSPSNELSLLGALTSTVEPIDD